MNLGGRGKFIPFDKKSAYTKNQRKMEVHVFTGGHNIVLEEFLKKVGPTECSTNFYREEENLTLTVDKLTGEIFILENPNKYRKADAYNYLKIDNSFTR